VFDDVGRPLLLLPFGIVRHRGIRILGFLDGAANDYNAPVVFEPLRTWTRDTLERLWQELLRVLPRFDVAMLEKMPSDICGAPNPLVGLGTPSRSGHLVNITTSWDEYAAHRLPYKRESVIQRRKLGKLGKVAFTVAETAADRQRMLQTMMRQKSRRYVETRGIDGLDRPGFRQYYNAMIERLGWPGPLFICALEVDGHVIATNWGFISNKRFLGIITSFEGGEWKRFSPGRLLLEDLLKWNFDNGSMIFDFGSGEESYKLPYCDEALSLYQANIPVTLVGKAYVYRLGRDTKIWRFVRRCARFAKLIAGRPAAQR
jgi:CelD/BcsL family acetyltransferase involved in cellulose biosynthesis